MQFKKGGLWHQLPCSKTSEAYFSAVCHSLHVARHLHVFAQLRTSVTMLLPLLLLPLLLLLLLVMLGMALLPVTSFQSNHIGTFKRELCFTIWQALYINSKHQ
jgi:hypothetical protein